MGHLTHLGDALQVNYHLAEVLRSLRGDRSLRSDLSPRRRLPSIAAMQKYFPECMTLPEK